MLPIKCAAQKYEWGRPAHVSEVAHLARANGSDIVDGAPYAELWMGTHPNCPASVAATGQNLSEWIQQHSSCLGDAVRQYFGPTLPFLLKVLSVNKALSIQSHPDKQLAEQLHRDHPQLYADDNHKPEMALALSDDFRALCSFAPLPSIIAALDRHAEIAGLVGQEALEALKAADTQDLQTQALRAAFTRMMSSPAEAVQAAVSSLVGRLQSAGVPLTGHDALALELDAQYPGGDVGVLSAFFLNLVSLRAGQALFLGANEPHAYLAGELVECMATSDNVIRAGLTPKFKHVDVLCQTLTYTTGLPEVMEGYVQPSSTPAKSEGSEIRVYRPPTEEFEIRAVTVTAGGAPLVLGPDPGPQVVLVQQGAGQAVAAGNGPLSGQLSAGLVDTLQLTRGCIFLVPAGTPLELQSSSPDQALKLWVAAVNATFFTLHSVLGPAITAPAKLPRDLPATRSMSNSMDGALAMIQVSSQSNSNSPATGKHAQTHVSLSSMQQPIA